MNQNNNENNFSEISLILGSLVFGIILIIMPFGTDKILPLITINKILGFILLTFSLIGILGSNEVRENNIGIFILDSISLLLQFAPIIIIIVLSYNFKDTWFILITKYTLLIISFFTSISIINNLIDSFKKFSFNGKKEIIESIVKIITCIVGLGTLLFQIIKYLITGH